MAFVRRRIELTFILGTGAFGEGPPEPPITIPADTQAAGTSVKVTNNTIILNGLRVRAHIQEIGNSTLGMADVMVWGLSLSHLNQLSKMEQYAMFSRNNRLIISAGDDKDGMGVVFEGAITQSWADLSSQPDSILHCSAMAGQFYLVKPAADFTLAGSSDVATIIDSMAHQMGFTLINNGVAVLLATPHYSGSIIEQLRRAAADADINLVVDQINKKIYITPRGAAIVDQVPLISPETGMVGYPIHDATGVICNTLFNRNIKILRKAKVQSQLANANAEWLVISVVHDLESEVHNGEWYTRFQATNLGNTHARPTLS